MVQVFPLSPDSRSHGVFINQQAAEPIVWNTVFLIKWIHLYRKILQSLLISLIESFFLADMLFHVWNLSPHDPGHDIAHAVVVADLFVLIPRSRFPALGTPLADLVRIFFGICQEQASAGSGYDLIPIKGDAVILPQSTRLNPLTIHLILCAKRLCRVFYDQCPVPVTDLFYFLHLCRSTIKVSDHDKLYFRIELKRLLQCFRTHIPGVIFRIDEDGFPVLIRDRVHRGIKCHVAGEHLLSCQGAPVRPCLSVQFLSGKLRGKMQGSRTGRQADGIPIAGESRHLLLNGIDIRADRRYPVRLDCVIHPVPLGSMHGRGGEPQF